MLVHSEIENENLLEVEKGKIMMAIERI